jgi:hypothetical protein
MTPELRLFLEAFGVGENVIRKATRLMKKLFSDQTVPDPYMGFLVTWDGPPYYGGWHLECARKTLGSQRKDEATVSEGQSFHLR